LVSEFFYALADRYQDILLSLCWWLRISVQKGLRGLAGDE